MDEKEQRDFRFRHSNRDGSLYNKFTDSEERPNSVSSNVDSLPAGRQSKRPSLFSNNVEESLSKRKLTEDLYQDKSKRSDSKSSCAKTDLHIGINRPKSPSFSSKIYKSKVDSLGKKL